VEKPGYLTVQACHAPPEELLSLHEGAGRLYFRWGTQVGKFQTLFAVLVMTETSCAAIIALRGWAASTEGARWFAFANVCGSFYPRCQPRPGHAAVLRCSGRIVAGESQLRWRCYVCGSKGSKSSQGYKGFVIEARSYELKDGGFSAEFSVEEHDSSGVTETQFYLPDAFPTQESAIEAALQAGRQKIDVGFRRGPIAASG
jgi:hypothetical protein